MAQDALESFGRLLMTQVRDKAIDDWKMIVNGQMKGERAEKIRTAMATWDEADKKLFLSFVSQIVDTTLHHFLWTLEQEPSLQMGVEIANESCPNLAEVSDGLAGELYSNNGWIARFSKESS